MELASYATAVAVRLLPPAWASEGVNCLPRFYANWQKDAQFQQVCSRQHLVCPKND